MKFTFDANQEYQITAIEAVADLFTGQPRINLEEISSMEDVLAAVSNRLDIHDDVILKNLQEVQTRYNISPDKELKFLSEEIETIAGRKAVSFPNFSVEMETGTGKTYVYIRTAMELFQRYGFRKYIVVVPSVAVREGVLKSLAITEQHLREIYHNLPYRYYSYDSANLSRIRQYSLSDSVEIMVMTIDSFNKESNVIRQSTDRLQGETPIHLVQATRPILILDEPQNMESELRIRALAGLNPLFALRYSATHRNPYNVVYRLTPFEAYRQSLVKRIEVASVIKEDDANQVFIRLEEMNSEKNTVTAKLAVHKLMKDGTVKEKTVKVKPGDSLEKKTGRPEYAGFDIDEINPGEGFLRFTNNIELDLGEERGADKEAIFAEQIHYTVEAHMRRQKRLKKDGIKVLSLFFIDRVDNYAQEDGIIRRLFYQAFDELKQNYPDWKNKNAEEVQAAYFSGSRKKDGSVDYRDTGGQSQADVDTYNLIMKDKERLLSFDEPVSFIFSHSALREGWDNPNVFQICTLNQTTSEIKKRQEVGRGIRLCVNQNGQRVHDNQTNILTVVANESYETYVENLQNEIVEDYGLEGAPPKPANARKRKTVKLRKEFTLKPEFKELWERIKHKTRYSVQIDTKQVVKDVSEHLKNVSIEPPRITITKAQVDIDEGDHLTARQMSSTKTAAKLPSKGQLPDILRVMDYLLQNTSPPVRLSRQTLFKIFDKYPRPKDALANPHEFAVQAINTIKDVLAEHLVSGIQYERLNEWYEMSLFEAELEEWEDYLVPAKNSIYDHIAYDSDIERDFVKDLEKRDDVKLFVKLPGWFVVQTPVGEYNPDWAIVMEDRDEHGEPTGKPMLYLVRETKGTTNLNELRPDERRKILCGKKHFKDALGVDYKVVKTVAEIR